MTRRGRAQRHSPASYRMSSAHHLAGTSCAARTWEEAIFWSLPSHWGALTLLSCKSRRSALQRCSRKGVSCACKHYHLKKGLFVSESLNIKLFVLVRQALYTFFFWKEGAKGPASASSREYALAAVMSSTSTVIMSMHASSTPSQLTKPFSTRWKPSATRPACRPNGATSRP